MFHLFVILLLFNEQSSVHGTVRQPVIYRENVSSTQTIVNNNTTANIFVWTVNTNTTGQSIVIEFNTTSIVPQTTLYIFDGDNYESELLAKLTYEQIVNYPPETVSLLATSGAALIHLHCTKLARFRANIRISFCPYDCNENGECYNGHCQCKQAFHGPACEQRSCPLNCSFSGQCLAREHDPSKLYCRCMNRTYGRACFNISQTNDWYRFFQDDDLFESRAWHSSVYHPDTDSILTFGGRNTRTIMNDLNIYSVNDNHLRKLPTRLPGLWGHSLTLYNNRLIVIGGLISDHEFNDKIWIYDIDSMRWRAIEKPFLTVAFHQTILVGNDTLFIVGGMLSPALYNQQIIKIHINNWNSLIVQNYSQLQMPMLDHSVFYYSQLHAMIVVHRNLIQLFYIEHKQWISIGNDQNIRCEHDSCKAIFYRQKLIFLNLKNQLNCYDFGRFKWIKIRDFYNSNVSSIKHGSIVVGTDVLFVLGGLRIVPQNIVWAKSLENLNQVINNSSFNELQCKKEKCSQNIFFLCRNTENENHCSSVSGWIMKQYMKISGSFVPFQTDIIENLSALSDKSFNKSSIFVDKKRDTRQNILQKFSAIIHPFTPRLRMLLKTNSQQLQKYEYEEFEDKNQSKILLHIIGSELIPTIRDRHSFEKMNILDELSHNNYRIEILNNKSHCSEYGNCFDCLSNLACTWQYSTKHCFVQQNTTKLAESVSHPSQCLSCETIQNCLLCNSLQFCYWNNQQCNSQPMDGRPKLMDNCCEYHTNRTDCLHGPDCLWCDRSQRCVTRTVHADLNFIEFCEDFDIKKQLQEIKNCPLACVHGRCQRSPDVRCHCDVGWTGQLCDRDCGCNYHSSCDNKGVGHCDKCRHSTAGQYCQRCRPGFYGNATSTIGCYPCHCNGHGSAEKGLCHPETGQCYCVPGTEGKNCERCSDGHYGDARDGGRCYLQCSTRTVISGLQSGARYFGLHPKQPRNRIVDCVWIVSASPDFVFDNEEFTGLKNRTSTRVQSILIRLLPTNLSNNCSTSRLFVFDGIPESVAGSRLYQGRYLPGTCDGISQTEFLATSGFATIVFSSNALFEAFNGSVELYHTNKPVHSFPAIVGKTLWRKQLSTMYQPTILTSVNDTVLFLHSGIDSMKITAFNITTQKFIDCNITGAPIPEQRYFAVLVKSSKNLLIHGGFDLNNFTVSGDLLQLKVGPNYRVQIGKIVQTGRPRALFGHTLTMISDSRAILIGGYSLTHGYNNQQFVVDLKNYSWHVLSTSGAKPAAIIGHSSSYSRHDDCVFVFGGKQLNDQHKFVITNSLLILDLRRRFWSRITASGFRSPIGRYLHSAGDTDTHFYVGGESSILWAYSYGCRQWSKMQIGRTKHIGQFLVTDQHLIVIVERTWLIAIPLIKELRSETLMCFDDDDHRHCNNHGNCIDCLTHTDCQWCSACAKNKGECIPRTETCDRLIINQFSRPQLCTNVTVRTLNECPSYHCQAADCNNCQAMDDCSWFHVNQLSPWIKNNQFYSSDSLWNCVPTPHITNVLDEFFTHQSEYITQTCSRHCAEITDCEDCLRNESNDCVWLSSLRRCSTRIVSELACISGQCGRILSASNYAQCTPDCTTIVKPTKCIQSIGCGWCQMNSTSGYCSHGGLLAPISDSCNGKWHFLTLPKENECMNGHHVCDLKTQECIDLDDGFQCRCLPGHRLEGSKCRPICEAGCVNGVCVSPNVCRCRFGYVGLDCSHQCHCNGHSNCPGVDSLDTCIECHNNTMGNRCEHCLPNFVGNPLSGIGCVSCSEYCHGHSDNCQLASEQNNIAAVCIECSNHTVGSQCGQCQEGYFQISNDIRDGCRPCSCNGHGTMCSPLTGEHCNCGNNTESERPCHLMGSSSHYVNKTYLLQSSRLTASYSIPCWTHQCTKCRDYFFGTPTNGHQCYRHLLIDKEYCFDPVSQDDCWRSPRVLLYGRTVFFAVQPRYMNVDIRLVITVIQGDVDVFISAMDDTFIVKTDPETGVHHTFLDSRILFYSNETASLDESGIFHQIRNPFSLAELFVHDYKPIFHTLNTEHEILIVRKLKQRIEITVPFRSVDLRQARIFVMLRGNRFNANYGQIMFRQDQCRIDLFIFFSVFFSSFFFCLSLSVITYKAKQLFEAHRTQIQREIELEIMASRPFGKIYIQFGVDNGTASVFRPILNKAMSSSTSESNVPFNRKASKSKLFRHFSLVGLRESPKIYPENKIVEAQKSLPGTTPTKCRPYGHHTPIAIEPTYDGLAAVITQIIQLPSQNPGSTTIAAASALVFHKPNTKRD